MQIEFGCSRMVILIGNYAVKLPNIKYKYPSCLWGLIHNLNERMWWRCYEQGLDEKEWRKSMMKLLCPVIYSNRFGLYVIMKRAIPLPKSFNCPVVFNWLEYRFEKLDIGCPAEKKIDSFGLLNNEIVAIDYA